MTVEFIFEETFLFCKFNRDLCNIYRRICYMKIMLNRTETSV